jgi:hypothetical protein
MARSVALVMLAVMAASTAACSTNAHRAPIPASTRGSTVARPLCGPEAPDATYSSTTTAPCIPTTTTTTSTTLPAPLPLGTAAPLSYNFGSAEDPQVASIQVAVNRVWSDATPILPPTGYEGDPATTLAGAVALLLQKSGLPPNLPIKWYGLEIEATTAADSLPIGLWGVGGPGAPYLTVVVNGRLASQASALDVSAYLFGVAG